MKAVPCPGDYYGKFSLVVNESVSALPLSAVESQLYSVKFPSSSRSTLTELASSELPSTSFSPTSGYVVFAKQPFVLQDFQSETIVNQIDIIGELGGLFSVIRYPFVKSLPISSFNFYLYEVKTPSADNSIIRTYTPTNSINPFTEFEFNKYYLIKAKGNFSINNPDPSIVADLQVGSISAGEVVPGGTNLQGFVEQLIRATFEPTFVEHSVYASTNLPASVEVGTLGITLSATFNSGAIVGSVIGGIWNPLVVQNVRSGSVSFYTLSGINNIAPYLEFPNKTIVDGPNTFGVAATYLQGPQPVNNRGNAFSVPLSGGTVTSSVVITGKRKAFYGTSIANINSTTIRSLPGNILGPQKGTSFTITIPANATNVVFAYPASIGSVASVLYVEGLNADIKNSFTLTTAEVSGANDFTPLLYNIYTYTPVEPYSEQAHYAVTI